MSDAAQADDIDFARLDWEASNPQPEEPQPAPEDVPDEDPAPDEVPVGAQPGDDVGGIGTALGNE